MNHEPTATDARPIELVAGGPSKAYSPGQAAGAAFLGSPIAASILLASNYKLFGQPDAGRKALFWGGVATVIVFAFALILPEGFPDSLLPAIYTASILEIARRRQGAQFRAYIASGGLKHSHWRVAGIGIACMLGVLAALFAIVMMLPPEFLGEDFA